MPRGLNLNMHAVAARAGVSTATVSRVISGSTQVRPETAAHVQKIIDELQFVPNASATALKYGRSDTYGIIIANVTNPFFLEFLRDFDNLLVNRRQGILVANTENHGRVASSIQLMLKNQVDGVIIMIVDEEFGPHYDRLSLRSIPTVTIDRRNVKPLVSDVSFQYEQGMKQAIAHLRALGHRRIAFIGGSEGLSSSRMRQNAFLSAIRDFKLKTRAEWIVDGNYLMDGGEQKMHQLMNLHERPTAVITINDMTALGAIRAAHTLQMSIPRDVSIIGFDDIMLADVVSPALTTVRLPREKVAKACVECFARMAEKPEAEGSQFYIETELIVRDSTAPPIK